MRYAILSDIHSNLEALTAVLETLAMKRVDRYLCLGDIVGYGADPGACLSRLQDCEAVMVAGNHELGCLGKLELDWFNEAARAAVLWTRDRLGFSELDSLRRLPLTQTLDAFTLVHGTLKQPARFEYLVEAGQAIDSLTKCRTPLCLVGHTHLPCFIEYDGAQRRLLRVLASPAELGEVTFRPEAQTTRVLLNPGSVGQPRDGDPRAGAAIVDTEGGRVEFLRIAYDVATAQRKIHQAGLPAFLAERLAVGR